MHEIKSKDFFEEELKIILFIHFDAKYYFKDNEYLNNPDTVDELRASANLLVKRIKVAFWRLGIIEISKLFQKSRSQHFNLIDYLTNLIENYENYDWIMDFPKSQLSDWLEKLNSPEILKTRRKIDTQRNKYFAHTDKKPKIELKDSIIEFKEIHQLLNFTEEIIFKLKVACFSTHVDMEIAGMEKAGHLLEMVSYYDTKRKQDLMDDFKNKKK